MLQSEGKLGRFGQGAGEGIVPMSPHKDSTRVCVFDLVDVSESRKDFLKREGMSEKMISTLLLH